MKAINEIGTAAGKIWHFLDKNGTRQRSKNQY